MNREEVLPLRQSLLHRSEASYFFSTGKLFILGGREKIRLLRLNISELFVSELDNTGICQHFQSGHAGERETAAYLGIVLVFWTRHLAQRAVLVP